MNTTTLLRSEIVKAVCLLTIGFLFNELWHLHNVRKRLNK